MRPFLSSAKISEICDLAFWSDKEVRSDLASGHIKDENDYTSNFTSAYRRNVNTYSKTGIKVSSHLLPVQEERNLGCDATIVIHSGSSAKIAVFEAKFPRFRTKNYPWDHIQQGTRSSHYSDQLERQLKAPPEYAVFEMFYCEDDFYRQPPFLDDEASSCLWRDETVVFRNARTSPGSIWNQVELAGLLQSTRRNIREILSDVCNCKVGTQIQISNNPAAILSEFRRTSSVLYIDASSADPTYSE